MMNTFSVNYPVFEKTGSIAQLSNALGNLNIARRHLQKVNERK